jgi:hypothetical protein
MTVELRSDVDGYLHIQRDGASATNVQAPSRLRANYAAVFSLCGAGHYTAILTADNGALCSASTDLMSETAGWDTFHFWPPPRPTLQGEIPLRTLVLSSNPTYRDIDDAFQTQLGKKGYSVSQYYAIPGGFAIVTSLEPMSADGKFLKHSRIKIGRSLSLDAILDLLFEQPRGYYGIMILAVTSTPFTPRNVNVTIVGLLIFHRAELPLWTKHKRLLL